MYCYCTFKRNKYNNSRRTLFPQHIKRQIVQPENLANSTTGELGVLITAEELGYKTANSTAGVLIAAEELGYKTENSTAGELGR